MDMLRWLPLLLLRRGVLRHRVRGGVTVMAFTDSGWTRRIRVPKLAVAMLAGLVATLTIVTLVSVSFAVWAGADLKRLAAIERENRSLTTLLQDQAVQLTRLQTEMFRLRELEKNLRSVSGLPEVDRGASTGRGGGLLAPPHK